MVGIRSGCTRLCALAVCISILATSHVTLCDARTLLQMFKFRGQEFHTSSVTTDAIKNLKVSNHLDMNPPILHTSNDELNGVSSPFSLVPFQSLAPLPSPENSPPFYVYPPTFTPQPPYTGMPSPSSYGQPSPTPPFYFTPTLPNQTPPPPTTPSPPTPVPNPPQSVPSPPPHQGPSPPKNAPSPPVPVVYPPPPPHKEPDFAVWCVAKPTVPNPIIQEAMDYACGTGADCKSIQPNGSCFKPNTVIAHASYAFNSYWQRTKVAGGTCDFGGSAMIVTVDPSFDGCQFIFY